MYEHANGHTPLTVFTDPQTGGRTFNASNGEVVYQPGTPAENFYFIRRGQVRLYTVGVDEDSTRLIEILGPGNWFGAAALAGHKQYNMRAVVVGSGAVITEIRIERLLAALSSHPNQLMELTRQLAGHLLRSHTEASRLVFEDCNQRLISALVRFSRSAASAPRDGGVVLRITHEQLAQAVGVARETVSLALTQLRQQNLLQTGRNQLSFNPEVLERMAASREVSTQSGSPRRTEEVVADSVA